MNQTKTRDKLDPTVVGMPLATILKKYVARFGEHKPDWNAFADAAIDGWRRAQHRFIGNTSGKPDENFIPAGNFTCLNLLFSARQLRCAPPAA